jgi:hypothetical protein
MVQAATLRSAAPGPAAPPIDATPVLPRSSANVWSRAEAERDRLYLACERALALEGLRALVLASGPSEFPAWVKVELWVPVGEGQTTLRASARIAIEARPYHRHELEYRVDLERAGKPRVFTRLLPFEQEDLTRLLAYLVARARKVAFREFRKSPWQLWRQSNDVAGVGRDWVAALPALAFLVGMMLFPIGGGAAALGALAIVGGLVAAAYNRGRAPLTRTEGKPPTEPRSLLRVDSWQAMLFGVGDQVAQFRGAFAESLAAPPVEKFRWRPEKLWHWGLDGKEEREQLVLTHGRGVVFVQVYRYGKDLYVGWDGHLNYGQWVEQPVRTGIDQHTRLLTTVTCVQPGVQTLSEYDIVDLSCLMEWTHAQLVKICKRFIEELHIDQEIDFTVLRGERQDLLSRSGETGRKRGGLFRRGTGG